MHIYCWSYCLRNLNVPIHLASHWRWPLSIDYTACARCHLIALRPAPPATERGRLRYRYTVPKEISCSIASPAGRTVTCLFFFYCDAEWSQYRQDYKCHLCRGEGWNSSCLNRKGYDFINFRKNLFHTLLSPRYGSAKMSIVRRDAVCGSISWLWETPININYLSCTICPSNQICWDTDIPQKKNKKTKKL